MKANDFVQAMGQVNEKYVEEAIGYKSVVNRSMKIWRAVAIAACALLAVSAAFGVMAVNSSSSKRSNSAVYSDNSGLYYSAEEMTSPAAAAGNNNTAREKAAADVSEDYEVYESGAVYDMDVPYEAAYDMEYEAAAEYERADANGLAAAGAGATPGTDAAEAAISEADTGSAAEKKIIYSVSMEMQTKEFDSAVQELESAVSDSEGYCEKQYISNASAGYRTASYTIRIPAENLDAFLEKAGDICTVTYMSRSALDVTDSYYDIESRQESARIKLKRLQELMNEAEDMYDLITLEEAITDVEWEIDSYGSTLKGYDSKVRYSTVELELDEVYEVIVEDVPMTFGERLGNAFSNGIRSIGIFFKNLLIWLAASWFWLLIIVVIVIVVIIIIKKAAGRRRSRRITSDNKKE